MKKKWLKSSIFSIFILSSTLSYALTLKQECEFNGVNYRQVKKAVTNLKTALKYDYKEKVAELIKYPLRVNTHIHEKVTHYYVKTKVQLIEKYDVIFNSEIKKTIIDDTALFCNYKGAMIGAGTVWFKTEGKSTKIVSINY